MESLEEEVPETDRRRKEPVIEGLFDWLQSELEVGLTQQELEGAEQLGQGKAGAQLGEESGKGFRLGDGRGVGGGAAAGFGSGVGRGFVRFGFRFRITF
jgi:hypothetical protein